MLEAEVLGWEPGPEVLEPEVLGCEHALELSLCCVTLGKESMSEIYMKKYLIKYDTEIDKGTI